MTPLEGTDYGQWAHWINGKGGPTQGFEGEIQMSHGTIFVCKSVAHIFLCFFHLVVCITVCWFGCQNVLNLSKVCAFSEKVVDSLERKRGRSFSRRD